MALVLTLATGCAVFLVGAAGAGAAGIAYVTGDLETHVGEDPRAVARASEAALKGLDIHVISTKASALDSLVVGRTDTDAKVTVTGKLTESGQTKVSIRVGVFGDEAMSRRILAQIRTHL